MLADFLVYEVTSSVALAIFLEELLDEFSILTYMLFVTIISIDEDYEVRGVYGHLGALVVAGRCPHTTSLVSVNRQSLDIDHTSSDTFIWFTCLAYTQSQGVSIEFVGIKATDAISVGDTCQVHQIYQGVYLVEILAL